AGPGRDETLIPPESPREPSEESTWSLCACQWRAKAAQSSRIAVTPSAQRPNGPARSPDTPAARGRGRYAPMGATISTGEARAARGAAVARGAGGGRAGGGGGGRSGVVAGRCGAGGRRGRAGGEGAGRGVGVRDGRAGAVRQVRQHGGRQGEGPTSELG